MQSQTVTTYQRVAPGIRKLGPVQSPVVSATITRRVDEVKANSAVKRAAASICIALLLLIDWLAGHKTVLILCSI